MSNPASIAKLARNISRLTLNRNRIFACSYSAVVQSPLIPSQRTVRNAGSADKQIDYQELPMFSREDNEGERKRQIGENVARRDKITILVNTLLDLDDSKRGIYGTLDAWVAWDQNFPIGSLKQVILKLEKEQQWHRVIQVIKWILSKGQGNTRGTYGQLIQALDKDHRAKEACEVWRKKIGYDLHSVPWSLCSLMISIYHRNDMLEDLVKLFKGLEAFGRKPPEKSIVQKVADAYEMLGLSKDKESLLEKYKDLFTETQGERPKTFRGKKKGKEKKEG